MPYVSWINTTEIVSPTEIQITQVACLASTTSSVTIQVATNVDSTVTGTITPGNDTENSNTPKTLHQLVFTGLSSSTNYSIDIIAFNDEAPSDTATGTANCATGASSGGFSISSDLTIIDPDGAPFLPVGGNNPAGAHSSASPYFTNGDGANINNNNHPAIALDGWTTTGSNPSAPRHLQNLQSNWPGWNMWRINISPGALPNWGSDGELRRVIKFLTDNKVVAMVANHATATQDPTSAQINASLPQWDALSSWAASNLTNPDYFWCEPWNEPGGSFSTGSVYKYNNNNGNVTHTDAWVDWHVPVFNTFLNNLPDNIVTACGSKAGQELNSGQATWRSSASCLATWMPGMKDGSGSGVPAGGYPNMIGSIHTYQRWGGSNPPNTWASEGVQLVADAAADLKSRGIPWFAGETGGNTSWVPDPNLRNDEYGCRAFITAKPNGVGLLWWGLSVRYNSGQALHGTTSPAYGNRVPVWHFTKKVLTQSADNVACSLVKNGERYWDWTRNPPSPTP